MWCLWFAGLTNVRSLSQQAQAPLLLVFRHVAVQEDGEVLERLFLAEWVRLLVVCKSRDHLLLDVGDAASGDPDVAITFLCRPSSEHVSVRFRDPDC